MPTGVDRIDADLNATANIDGTDQWVNVDIAIIDTGIDPKHPDLNVFRHVRCTGTAWFSNLGLLIEVAAPGVDILSTWLSGQYYTISGTSMAAPHGAGAAALYMADNPGASPAGVRDALIASGTPQGGAQGFLGDPDGVSEPLLDASGL